LLIITRLSGQTFAWEPWEPYCKQVDQSCFCDADPISGYSTKLGLLNYMGGRQLEVVSQNQPILKLAVVNSHMLTRSALIR
jgi:hypothetical protein